MFGGGGGGLNPRKMKQMMEQMGIDMQDIDAEEVRIRTPEEELVFTDADVQLMEAQGQKTYQIVGEPESRPRGDSGADESAAEASDTEATADEAAAEDDEADTEIPDSDVEIVANRTGVSEADAREALREADGNLAAAVERLE